jgi:hypothetical protein
VHVAAERDRGRTAQPEAIADDLHGVTELRLGGQHGVHLQELHPRRLTLRERRKRQAEHACTDR